MYSILRLHFKRLAVSACTASGTLLTRRIYDSALIIPLSAYCFPKQHQPVFFVTEKVVSCEAKTRRFVI
jgi:hypothetical protein